MSDNPEDYELVHYGIKGMKWGRRRPDGPDGTVSSGAKSGGKTSDKPGIIKGAVSDKNKLKVMKAEENLHYAKQRASQDKGADRRTVALSTAAGATAGFIGGGVVGAVGGGVAGAGVGLYATSKKGKARVLKYAQQDYDRAKDYQKRIDSNQRSKIERILDASDVRLGDVMVSQAVGSGRKNGGMIGKAYRTKPAY